MRSQCRTTPVQSGLAALLITMSGCSATPTPSTKNIDTDMEKNTSRCTKSYYDYRTPYTYLKPDLQSLLWPCQMSLRLATSSPVTDPSIIRIRPHLLAGNIVRSPNGGMKMKQITIQG